MKTETKENLMKIATDASIGLGAGAALLNYNAAENQFQQAEVEAGREILSPSRETVPGYTIQMDRFREKGDAYLHTGDVLLTSVLIAGLAYRAFLSYFSDRRVKEREARKSGMDGVRINSNEGNLAG